MKSGYDALYGIFAFFLILTVALHLCIPKAKSITEEKTVTVSITKISGTPKINTDVSVDGKYRALLVDSDDETLTLKVNGEYLEAGFFAFRAKYLCLNQPIVFFAEWGYAEGRITDIY
jgi:hypothetical protein